MRKLKLQMVISLDGFLTAVHGEGNFEWDKEVFNFCLNNLKNVDCILHGRKTAEGFIPYWADVANNPADENYILGKPLTEIPNFVFSNKLKTSKWDNVTVVKGDIVEEIKKLKRKKGKDIMVYGGNSFVSSLVQHGLIDEYYLLLNPGASGGGKAILKKLQNDLRLTLVKCKPFKCGTVLLCYKPN
ncbi:MAG: dihydrofolate reductase family protein [Pyrinomonadaceae bacterium]